ncbi:hypothetical protein VaNZ11_003816 [Volvox africanus]|uniref:NYN domain-containing protein n=1 Tax=Volvox africanus TaxID=51714 RepID=A0ABQ5RWP3_9CHLO|nr:hypothetical protein VaNZ11_003816 [Volvox africanus]
MGCTDSRPERFESPTSAALNSPPRVFIRCPAKSESGLDNATSSTIIEPPGALSEEANTAASSRLRTHLPESCTRNLVQLEIRPEEQSVRIIGPSEPVNVELPNMVCDDPVTSGRARDLQPCNPPLPESKAELASLFVESYRRTTDVSPKGAKAAPEEPAPTLSNNLPPVSEAPSPKPTSPPSPSPALEDATLATKIAGKEQSDKVLVHLNIPHGPVVADGRKLVLLVWDIEHVRCPIVESITSFNKPWRHPLSPQNVLGYLKQHFVYDKGRIEYRTVAALSEGSLRKLLRFHEKFVELAVPNLSIMLAAKGNVGAVLSKEVRGFINDHAHIAQGSPGQLTVVFIAREDHFTDVRQEASERGFRVELLTQRRWVDFLRYCSGQRTVKLVN